ncbi:MAG: hypothetical protein LBO05_00145, partial [Deltaproteobacteria bacterium]|nr:hypothetical protein [Deltaproteobacteria bacterium]
MTGMSLGSILSAGKLLVGGRETRGGLQAKAASAAGLLVVTSPAPTSASLNSKESPTAAAARTQSTLYENFSSEILKRLKDAAGDKKTGTGSLEGDPADPAALADSLAGAMGEIEEIFGREAATEAMAKILLGTENGAGRESVMASLETVLAGLGKLGRTGLEIRQLVEGFNRDLTLGEKELAEKIDSGATMSLSNALASFFGSQDSLTTGAGAGNGSLAADENSAAAGAGTGESSPAQGDNSPGEGEKRADGGAVISGAGLAAFADAAYRRSLTGGQSHLATAAAMTTVAEEYVLDPSGPPGASPPGFADPSGDASGGGSEKFTAMAFSLDGKWGRVEFEVRKAAPEDVRLAGEKGLETGVEVTLANLADKGGKAFADLLSFVKTNMNDDELEVYLAEKISQAEKYLEQEYGPNPKMGEVLAAVYAKTAEDGD